MSRRAEALLLASFFVAHAIEATWLHTPWDTIWACHIACLWVAAGALRGSGLFAAIGLFWLVYGTPLWILDVLSGTPMEKTSVLTHLGGLVLAVRVARREGVPPGAWWKALAALFCLVMLTRVLTPAAANVNLAFAVYPGFEKWFPTYPRYFVFLLVTNGLSYWLTERLARRVLGGAVRPAGDGVREAA